MEPSSGLTFVTVGPEEVRKRKTSRSLVRSHAMSKVWEERKEKHAKRSTDRDRGLREGDMNSLTSRNLARGSTALGQCQVRPSRSRKTEPGSSRSKLTDSEGWVEEDLADAIASSGLFGIPSPPCSCGDSHGRTSQDSWSISPHNSDSENSLIPIAQSPDSFGAGLLDPFNTAVFPLDRRASRHIQYYFENMSWKLTMPKNPWLSYAITDEALLHATIFHSAAHYHRSTNQRMGRESFNHLGLAMRMVRERLQDPDQATTEATIGTIARMVTGYAIYGPHDTWMQHTQGLENMLTVRGALSDQGFGKYIQHALEW